MDEDLAGVGRGLMHLRNDVVIGSLDPVSDLVPRKDEERIPEVAKRGWVAITADRHIRTRFDEATPAIEHGLRCVCRKPPGRDAVRWDYVRMLASHGDAVEQLCTRIGPAWLELSRLRTRHRDYQPGQPSRLPHI
ncbi:PIN-like domain-containing protein [Amycolatopsis pigmentata]|uniref:VapC45 PIN like domain-containing protein n=1 Tax=Amycolatopsis pigmentata TaxID=450801 RepID=A0ABW5FXY5_9PSEU